MNFFLQSVNYFDTEEKIIALSFDDGPSPNLTPQILDILKTHQVEACFFCIGSRMTGQELLLNRIVKENHIIGNHSYSHSHFFDLFNAKKMLKDIQQMSLACKDMTGRYPVFFRPPYGVTNPNLKKAVEKAGFVSIGWTIRSYDTIINQEEKLLERIVSRIKPGAIILLHDTNETTVRMLPRLIERISEKGFKTKRLDKMIKLEPYA